MIDATDMVTDEPLISIVTIAYNSESTIRQTIESVLTQTYPNIEYIIVDGKSNDATVSVAESYTDKFDKRGIVYTIISEKDNGIYDAMNKGIKNSHGQIVGMINSNDWYEPDAIEKVAVAYTKTNFEVLYATERVHRIGGGTLLKKSKLNGRIVTSRNWNHPTMFVAREVYSERLYACETIYDDFDMYLKFCKEKRNIVILDDVLANFKAGGISNEKNLVRIWRRLNVKYKVYRKNGYSRLYWLECALIEAGKFVLY